MSEGSEQGPKLYTNKPRKEQIKRHQKPSAAMGTQTTAAPPPPPPPPPPPQPKTKEPFVRRYKFLWPMLLAVNLAVGGDSSSPQLRSGQYY